LVNVSCTGSLKSKTLFGFWSCFFMKLKIVALCIVCFSGKFFAMDAGADSYCDKNCVEGRIAKLKPSIVLKSVGQNNSNHTNNGSCVVDFPHSNYANIDNSVNPTHPQGARSTRVNICACVVTYWPHRGPADVDSSNCSIHSSIHS
jgi:hypothetical protein